MNVDELHRDLILIDGLESHGESWSEAHFAELRDGGVTAVNVTLAIWENARETLTHIARWHRRIREHAEYITHAATTSDILAAKRDGKTAVLFGFQNTDPLESDLDMVELYARLGVRVIQLTYNTQNAVGSGGWEDGGGLSKFYGRNVVREMNRFGILVDVSHCTDETCLGAIEASERPIAVTHANPRSFVGDEVQLPMRNKGDEVLRQLAASGGIIGLSHYPKIAPDGPDCTLERFCEMVAWTVERIGIDHVGIGTDFCQAAQPTEAARARMFWVRTGRWSREPAFAISSSPFPEWMPNPAHFRTLTQGLVDKGFGEEEIRKILGGNFLRVLGAAIDESELVPAASPALVT